MWSVASIAVASNCANVNILLLAQLQKHMKNTSKLLNLMAGKGILICTIFFRLIYLEHSATGISMSRRREDLQETTYPQSPAVSRKMNLSL